MRSVMNVGANERPSQSPGSMEKPSREKKTLNPFSFASLSLPRLTHWPSTASAGLEPWDSCESALSLADSELEVLHQNHQDLFRPDTIIDAQDHTAQNATILTRALNLYESSHSYFSFPKSCAEPFIVNDYEIFDREDFYFENANLEIRAPRYSNRCSLTKPDGTNTVRSRSSEMSFQCRGEPLFNESEAFLSDPVNVWSHARSESLPQVLARSMPQHNNVDSWLTDENSDIEEDFLACATVLAPSKAQVVSVNTQPLSSNTITVPPRSSSLGTIRENLGTFDNPSWQTFGPESCSNLSDSENLAAMSPSIPFSKNISHPPLPKLRLDLAMPCPTSSPVNIPYHKGVTERPQTRGLHQNATSQSDASSIESTTSSADDENSICTPSKTHDSEHCTHLRPAPRVRLEQGMKSLWPLRPKDISSSHDDKSQNYRPRHRRHSSYISFPKLEAQAFHRTFKLEPSMHSDELRGLTPKHGRLRRASSSSADALQSALQAIIMAYSYISSQPDRDQNSVKQRHIRDSCDLGKVIPTKAATVLGMLQPDDLCVVQQPRQSRIRSFGLPKEEVEELLRQNIRRLRAEMGESIDLDV